MSDQANFYQVGRELTKAEIATKYSEAKQEINQLKADNAALVEKLSRTVEDVKKDMKLLDEKYNHPTNAEGLQTVSVVYERLSALIKIDHPGQSLLDERDTLKAQHAEIREIANRYMDRWETARGERRKAIDERDRLRETLERIAGYEESYGRVNSMARELALKALGKGDA